MTGTTTVDATMNSFRILERLVASDEALGVTELAADVGLSKGVVHTHLNTLSELGYVTKRDRKYLASMGLLALGEEVRSHLGVFTAARQHLDNLARVTGEVSTLFVEEDGVGICAYMAHGPNDWTPEYACGTRIPLHVTAPGKAMLASLGRERVDDILDEHGLDAQTAETITDRNVLRGELRTIRENGISFCREEQSAGVIGVGTSIALTERAPAAAIGVCGPSSRLTGRYLEEDITGQVISTAKSIQVELTR
ncbi:IclR family transcriptional regulator [Haloferax sp. Atlit-12N]|uniref:IclR family transcriptional regulator n=1 Tax=Haloferax sp. Atlit-12N TaxID=2077203 RepID=UPI000E232D28|nr:IclR family transcriptional regulator [Haloferax sp. Atlit-12N]RDZ63882.1 IclR family transcriptional regulator [Haloferax sp. Atlit-12N]